jgi:hypothetical protein
MNFDFSVARTAADSPLASSLSASREGRETKCSAWRIMASLGVDVGLSVDGSLHGGWRTRRPMSINSCFHPAIDSTVYDSIPALHRDPFTPLPPTWRKLHYHRSRRLHPPSAVRSVFVCSAMEPGSESPCLAHTRASCTHTLHTAVQQGAPQGRVTADPR